MTSRASCGSRSAACRRSASVATRCTDSRPRSSTRWPASGEPTSTATLRNVRAHYDLGNDFFGHLLDETMAYSCAIFDAPGMTLADASRAKFDRLARTLDLSPGDRLLEIGTGWGGFALHAAEHYGCLVTTTTISSRAIRVATERVRAAGLERPDHACSTATTATCAAPSTKRSRSR